MLKTRWNRLGMDYSSLLMKFNKFSGFPSVCSSMTSPYAIMMGKPSGDRTMGQRRIIAESRILITGASQGIGKALAEAAAARGAKVLVCARQIDLLLSLAQQIRAKGGIIEVIRADITSPRDRQEMVE